MLLQGKQTKNYQIEIKCKLIPCRWKKLIDLEYWLLGTVFLFFCNKYMTQIFTKEDEEI